MAISRRRTVNGFLASMALLASGCSAMPASGPYARDIRGGSPSFSVIDLNLESAQAINRERGYNSADAYARNALPPPRRVGGMGPGDALRVSIWEANPTGSMLFERPALEHQVRVSPDGSVTIPHVGRIHVAGRSPRDVEAAVIEAVGQATQGMQASVMVAEDVTNTVIVQGELARSGRYALTTPGMRIMDVLAMAGGASVNAGNLLVRLVRGNSQAQFSLSEIMREPSRDVLLGPGDRLLVSARNQYFYAFGAVTRTGEQVYDADDINLTRVLGRVAGLNDQRASPGGVFIYRRQDHSMTNRLAASSRIHLGDPSRVIYRVDLSAPDSFFVADSFRMEPGDVLYVTNAPIADIAKVIQLFTGLNAVASVPRTAGMLP